ncbi:MAG: trimethylamine methyltransferase family protein, partial [Desulfobacteraceae bacterium]|nr:trimethylamine methyltransferase family protein [Desulfobacteraceae bacterium]
MNRVLFNFDNEVLDKIHNSSLELLKETGIRFPNKEALGIFKHHGFKIDGEMVFFQQQDIEKALETVPEIFELHARNENNSFVIGDDSYRMAPGYGPPFIIETSGEMRHAVLDDTKKFCKLVQTSKALDFNSSIVVQPNDVPAATAHLDMLLSTILFTDKPLMGSTSSKACAEQSLEMARMIWGSTDKPVMLNLVDSLSPLQYAEEMVDALLVYAKAKQPLIIHSSCSMGSS